MKPSDLALLKSKLPLSASTLARNPVQFSVQVGDSGTAPVVEQSASDGIGAKDTTKASDAARFLVRVESVRKRLLDTDNLCAKHFIDCCRFAGILPDDSPDKTEIQISQRKAVKGESERTIIEVYRITTPTP